MSIAHPNASRADKVLKILRASREPLSAAAIARKIGWKSPSMAGAANVHAACSELIAGQLVERVERPRLDQPTLYKVAGAKS